MAKRHKFTPSDFEKSGSSNLSATIYASMLNSDNWMKLSNNAKVLYMYMKLQYYGQNPKPIPTRQDTFYFNKSLYMEKYGLYKNGAQFTRDKNQLIQYGFIEEIENGHTTRTKNIYRFSDKWKYPIKV